MSSAKVIDGREIGRNIMALFWFAGVFLTVFSSKLWLTALYGSALPWWDAWDIEGRLYIAFFENKLAFKDLFAVHCEHRFFVNRVLALLTLMLNGQWDARIGIVLNAAMAAGAGAALSYAGWKLLNRNEIAVVCWFNAIVFSLPFAWEYYLLIALSLPAVWFLIRAAPFRPAWWLGVFFALLSLVTAGSGFFVVLAAAGVIFLRLVTRQSPLRLNLAGMAVLLGITAAGFFLRVSVPGHEAYKPATIVNLITGFCRNMAWPDNACAWTAAVIWLPACLVFIRYVLYRDDERNKYEFILGLGLWIALQAAALAFARCGALASRHAVFLSLSLPLNFLALLILRRDRMLSFITGKPLLLILFVWMGFVGHGLWKIPYKTNFAEAEKFKQHLNQSEKNVRSFLRSDNIADLENKPFYDIPYPDPRALASFLRNPRIRAILPSCAAPANEPGPISAFVSKMLPGSAKLLLASVVLMAVLAAVSLCQAFGAAHPRQCK
ncbi:MAG: hypothetical protein PHP98_02140 [Kiritimatiellae bacterium]|nr:hypothetical protein [Kiritimatiellia bacterium]